MKLTDEQIVSLAGFACEILDNWPDDWGSWEGFDLQDLAEKHKLLIPRTVTEPCGENCNCAECYTDEEMKKGVTCYHLADWLARDAEQAVGAVETSPTEDGEELSGVKRDEQSNGQ